MPRTITYCPSPLLLRSIDTPDTRWAVLATDRSGEISIALAETEFWMMSARRSASCEAISVPLAPPDTLTVAISLLFGSRLTVSVFRRSLSQIHLLLISAQNLHI